MSTDLTPTVTTSLTELVAEEIRVVMTRRRTKQSDLARALGKSEQWVSVRLRGTQAIDLNDLQSIADALAVDVTDLLPVREGRVVTHAGAPRRQLTVPKMGSPIALTKRPTGGRPHGRTSALPPIAASNRRVTRTLAPAV